MSTGEVVDLPVARIAAGPKVSTDGGSVDFMALAGDKGALTLRQAALRDKPAAATTLARCERLLRIAELIEAETKRLGRPVSVAEVIERVAA